MESHFPLKKFFFPHSQKYYFFALLLAHQKLEIDFLSPPAVCPHMQSPWALARLNKSELCK